MTHWNFGSTLVRFNAASERTGSEPTPTFGDLHAYTDEPAPVAPDADACGALGCQRTDELRRVEHPKYGPRVVCPPHLRELLRGEDR